MIDGRLDAGPTAAELPAAPRTRECAGGSRPAVARARGARLTGVAPMTERTAVHGVARGVDARASAARGSGGADELRWSASAAARYTELGEPAVVIRRSAPAEPADARLARRAHVAARAAVVRIGRQVGTGEHRARRVGRARLTGHTGRGVTAEARERAHGGARSAAVGAERVARHPARAAVREGRVEAPVARSDTERAHTRAAPAEKARRTLWAAVAPSVRPGSARGVSRVERASIAARAFAHRASLVRPACDAAAPAVPRIAPAIDADRAAAGLGAFAGWRAARICGVIGRARGEQPEQEDDGDHRERTPGAGSDHAATIPRGAGAELCVAAGSGIEAHRAADEREAAVDAWGCALAMLFWAVGIIMKGLSGPPTVEGAPS